MTDDQPNILLMMCDQLNPRVLGCYGGPVPTPNIDRLARDGVLFTEATCSTPFCSPTRASMITGLYPHTHGIVQNLWKDYPGFPSPPPPTEEGITEQDVTLDNLLHEEGYETHQFGKWHLRGEELSYYPDMFGEHREYARSMAGIFEEIRKQPRQTWMDWYGWAVPVQVTEELKAARGKLAARWKDKYYLEFIGKMGRLELPPERNFDVQVADKTIECLNSLGSAPFSITCSFNYPHDPNVVPSPYYEAFKPQDIALPANSDVREPRFETDFSREAVRDFGEVLVREFLRVYYASVKLVDDQVGRILDALEEAGRARETVVVFTADHSDMAGGHGMIWKSTSAFYEDVVRVPLIIRFPGALQPARTDIAAGSTDLMPTLLDLAGHPVPAHVQGHTLAPYLAGERDVSQAPAYAFSERVAGNAARTRTVAPGTPGSFMIRGRGWKYVRYHDGEEYLYDLVNDPGEAENLSAQTAAHDRKRELSRELDAWLVETRYPAG